MIYRFRHKELQRAYGINCLRYPLTAIGNPPFQPTWCQIQAGEKTSSHAHDEPELFVVIQGRGTIKVGACQYEITPGDVICVPTGVEHQLSGIETMDVLSLYWQPQEQAHQNFRIVAAPPTPNGKLHLGHVSGPYLAASILARYLRLQGHQVETLCGSDDHQSYVAAEAKRVGCASDELCRQNRQSIRRSFRTLDISWDSYITPHGDSRYENDLCHTFGALMRRGILVKKNVPVLMDAKNDQELYGGFIKGLCPHCHQPAGGGLCESCGTPNQHADLIHPEATYGGAHLMKTTSSRIVFDLEPFVGAIRRRIEKIRMPDRVRCHLMRIMDQGLSPMQVSHQASWGLPVVGCPEQVMNEWFEMALGYIWRHPTETPRARVIQCFGIDNAYFYGIVHLALYEALGRSDLVAESFVVNEFLQLNGKKFSTSRNHAIWVEDLPADFPPEFLQLYMLYIHPDTSSTNLTLEHFSQFLEDTVLNVWLPSLSALVNSSRRYATGHMSSNSDHAWTKLLRKISTLDDYVDPHAPRLRNFVSQLETVFHQILELHECFTPQQSQELSQLLNQKLAIIHPHLVVDSITKHEESVRTARRARMQVAVLHGASARMARG